METEVFLFLGYIAFCTEYSCPVSRQKISKNNRKNDNRQKTPVLEAQHTLRLMRWQIQAAFCLLTDHLNIKGQKPAAFYL